MTNTENTPIEALDTHYPVRVDRYTLRRGVVARVGFRVARVSRGDLVPGGGDAFADG